MNDALNIAPLEIWDKISESDPKIWYALSRVIRGLETAPFRDRTKNRGVTIERRESNGSVISAHFLYGRLHRDRGDGPAVYDDSGKEFYYRKGLLHREDGPAIDYGDGDVEYYRNGRLHRIDGPAVIHSDGFCLHYVDGVRVLRPTRTDRE